MAEMKGYIVVFGIAASKKAAKGKATRIKNATGIDMHIARSADICERYYTFAGPYEFYDDAEEVQNFLWSNNFIAIAIDAKKFNKNLAINWR